MYKKSNSEQTEIPDFYLPFGGSLDPNNRWVKLAKIVPWDIAEEYYSQRFVSKLGTCAFNVRVSLGTLIIKEHLGLSDRDTVEQIKENPYLQFFIGLKEFQIEEPFDHSSITNFRKRFTKEILAEINEAIVNRSGKKKK